MSVSDIFPMSTFWTVAEMLAWLGEEKGSKALMECVESVSETGVVTPDLGGKATTSEVTEAVCAEIGRLL